MRQTLVSPKEFGKSEGRIVLVAGGNAVKILRTTAIMLVGLALAGCDMVPFQQEERPRSDAAPPEGTTRPQARPEATSARVPAQGARTADQFDTTTPEERRQAAAAPAGGGEKLLGETVASLGDPAAPGFWLETPLVKTRRQGRVLNPATGKSAQVDLVPIEGPATGGSRVSLAAMRVLGAALTDLPTLRVFAGG